MDKGFFTDYSQKPSQEDVQLALGPSYLYWKRLTLFIESNYQITGVWSSWGPANSGWGLRFRRKGKALIALYPQKGQFMAQVILGKKQAERALDLKLGKQVRKTLIEAPQLHDGRWLSIPVINQTNLEDVEQLLLIKMPPITRKG